MPVTKEEKPKKVAEKEESTGSEETGSTSGESTEGSSTGTGSTASSTASSSSSEASGSSKKGAVKQEAAVGRVGGGRVGERDKELDSLTIEMRSGKRLFVDAKENQRGKFIRVAEVGASSCSVVQSSLPYPFRLSVVAPWDVRSGIARVGSDHHAPEGCEGAGCAPRRVHGRCGGLQ
jgi:hypothetical protein